jgi:hypothetical protein
VDVFVSFKFHDGEAAFVGGGQHVKHGAVRRGEGGDLRIERTRVQPAVDYADVGRDQRFQLTLGAQPEQGMLAGP